jgi:HPt (histidine-containing phosphotransfer) domain-containing protein
MAEAGPSSFDHAEAMRQAGGDADLLCEVMGLFVQELPQREADLRRALERRDAKGLEHAAHSIKGSCAVFGATATRAAAHRLELLGRAGSFEGAAESFALLSKEAARLTADLRKFLDAGRA